MPFKGRSHTLVNDSLLDFAADHRDIINRKFSMTLPVCINSFSKQPSEVGGSTNSNTGQDNKRQKRDREQKRRGNDRPAKEVGNVGIKNDKPRKEWQLCKQESWRKIFTS
jgi:hypothetical protein